MALHALSLCTGGGGLDLGVRLAGRVCGFEPRVVCYVEREAYAAEVLVARMQDGVMDDAPIWSDLKTFDPGPWRGKVDLITAGYPCQGFSHAGKRRGSADPRHLWPYIAKIIRAVEPGLCFFENVDGHLTLGFREVRQDLEEMGYRVEAIIVSAAEAGATHLRKRLFVLAVATDPRRRAVSLRASGGVEGPDPGRPEGDGGPGERGAVVADAANDHRRRGERQAQAGVGSDGERRRGLAGGVDRLFPPPPDDLGSWAGILTRRGDLAPALPNLDGPSAKEALASEPELRRMADELAPRLGELGAYRSERLQLLGNGVVPASAAVAFCLLARRIGLIRDERT